MKCIEFDSIKLKIGNNLILDNITFNVDAGDIYGLIGHNGAGKTSLIKILLGLINSYSGEIKIFSDRRIELQRCRIGSVIDSLGIDSNLTAEQYVHRICRMTGRLSPEIEKKTLCKVGLSDTGRKKIKNFSLGMQKRLMIAGALVSQPDLLVLDEPFNGIDPEGMAELRLLLQQLSAEGITVLITSHNIPELLKLANKFGIMHMGNFICEISETELANSQKFKTVFSTGAPQQLVSVIKKLFPDIDCYANSPREISVFQRLDDAQRKLLNSVVPDDIVTCVSVSTMNEEEFLLWKMNGHTES